MSQMSRWVLLDSIQFSYSSSVHNFVEQIRSETRLGKIAGSLDMSFRKCGGEALSRTQVQFYNILQIANELDICKTRMNYLEAASLSSHDNANGCCLCICMLRILLFSFCVMSLGFADCTQVVVRRTSMGALHSW